MRKLDTKTIVVASHNAGKIREIQDLIGPLGFTAKSAAELNFIEPDETIEQAVVREVQEEAGVKAEVEAVLGLRSRYDPDSGNGVYIILLLRPVSGEPTADNHEVDHAGYFTLEQIRGLNPLPPVNWEIAQRVLAPDRRLLYPKPLANLNGAQYTLFVG